MKIERNPKSVAGLIHISFDEGKVSFLRERDGARELVIGGAKKGLSRRKLILLARKCIAVAKQHRVKELLFPFDAFFALADKKQVNEQDAGEIATTAFLMADFEFTTFKTTQKDGGARLSHIAISGLSKAAQAGVERGIHIGEEVNKARTLANMPGGDMTPDILAKEARAAAKGLPISVKVLGVLEMQKLGMGGILGVGKGSKSEPRFIIMEYKGGRKSQKPAVFVGKGITFDTGGLNIKPDKHMYEMHLDMSGGAAVIHALALAARLKVKANLVGLIPAAENSPSGESYRPGDQLKSLSGKYIEVLHTDAEGRVVLADGITYAKRYDPIFTATVATLTGSAMVALGQHASAIFSRSEEVIADLRSLGERSGDYVWPLPMWEEYEEMVQGIFGDVANETSKGNPRYGGAISGAMFLWEFAKELPGEFVHIDMAPRMTAVDGEYLAKGAAGAPVRLLLAMAEHHARVA